MPKAYEFFIEENFSNILSKILFLTYRKKYKLFKSISKINFINFEEICSKCGNNINNIIYSFKSYENSKNENNQNYNLCAKCLSEIKFFSNKISPRLKTISFVFFLQRFPSIIITKLEDFL